MVLYFVSLQNVLLLIAVLRIGVLATTPGWHFESHLRALDANSSMEIIGDIPQCALSCLVEVGPAIGCELLDIECQCASKNSTQIMTPCLRKNCAYDDIFKLLHLQGDLCQKPRNNRSLSIKLLGWITGIVTVTVVTMRFISRYLGGSRYWWDDWLHLASGILVVPMTVALLLNAEAGIGHHVWDLTYDQVKRIGMWTYVTTICWAFELLLLKFSILCLYMRIFPNVWLRRAVIIFAVFSILYTMPLIGLAIFQCYPIYAIWDLDAQKTAKCIDWIAVLRATVVFEVIAEVLIFILPVPVVVGLKLRRSKKIQIIVFFGLGICVIGISVARLPTLPGVVSSDDQPYTTFGATLFGFLASVVGHICAAVPSVRGLIRLMCGHADESAPSAQIVPFNKLWSGWGAWGSSGRRPSWISKSSWLSRSTNSQTYQSHDLSMQDKPKIKNAGAHVSHFGAHPPRDSQDDVVLSELTPPRERTYQPGAQRERRISHWKAQSPTWLSEEEQPPTLLRDKWQEAHVDDSSSEKEILRKGSADSISVHVQMDAMEGRIKALETELSFYKE